MLVRFQHAIGRIRELLRGDDTPRIAQGTPERLGVSRQLEWVNFRLA
jgi:hypothetical protein